ncbi:MAG TPA: HepT-like ribonuclease domain-containing protein [Polyangiaceae bacterium]|nr:HepT-like ribonuclease domain-containing protein [Polyangiaceae bacterium]
MSPGTPDPATVRRHLLALDEALSHLETLAGLDAQQLKTDLSQRWAVERGLQIAVQNVLDIATHLVASAGHDVTDYTTSIDPRGRERPGASTHAMNSNRPREQRDPHAWTANGTRVWS